MGAAESSSTTACKTISKFSILKLSVECLCDVIAVTEFFELSTFLVLPVIPGFVHLSHVTSFMAMITQGSSGVLKKYSIQRTRAGALVPRAPAV